MKNNFNIKATSIVEAMIVLLIIVTWVIWMYKILNESNKLVITVRNKIQATQIARQWIEAFTNIRDTNWILFSSDYENCWNVLNYNPLCIWSNNTSHDIESANYKIILDEDNRWTLEKTILSPSLNYSDLEYRNFYKIWLDLNWIYTHSGIITEIKPLYTRELSISYLQEDLTPWNTQSPKIKIISKVQWSDNTSTAAHKIEIEQILSNWKSKK